MVVRIIKLASVSLFYEYFNCCMAMRIIVSKLVFFQNSLLVY